jgi:alpha-L-rhamnosidase
MTPDDVAACTMCSHLEETRRSATSDPRLNGLASDTQWGRKDHFGYIPTDSPQGEERIGRRACVIAFRETANQHFHIPAYFNHHIRCWQSGHDRFGGITPI